MRLPAGLAALVLALPFPLVAAASGGPRAEVELRDVPRTDGHWQEARGLVDAPPEVVREWLTDVARWPERFGDVARIEILRREGPVTVFCYHSRGNDRKLVMRARPTPEGMVFSGEDGDVRTEGKYFVTPTSDGRTDVVLQNAAHVGGLLGALAPGGMIKSRQREALRAEVLDLQRLARRRAALSER